MEPLISSLPWLRLRKVEDSINMIFGRGRPLLSGLARGFSVDHPKTTFGGCGLFSELLPNSCRDVSSWITTNEITLTRRCGSEFGVQRISRLRCGCGGWNNGISRKICSMGGVPHIALSKSTEFDSKLGRGRERSSAPSVKLHEPDKGWSQKANGQSGPAEAWSFMGENPRPSTE
ncbi:hypothetical protein CIHG_01992 [Coccidioides immitis H538.4]|uniref:Uncharacterized protein n=2 Tax=Coccidioides immitis TaxID=5501 RepID=A0A0J8RHY1_COCIT|nr:hypothetical protein CIRG_06309 [Coccidioides immitis RMSCC 2394]KMU84206.1 hypothetical protein CIHG_01992 [Coccidioides immitis H538.4]